MCHFVRAWLTGTDLPHNEELNTIDSLTINVSLNKRSSI
jgi:hypothetical protein